MMIVAPSLSFLGFDRRWLGAGRQRSIFLIAFHVFNERLENSEVQKRTPDYTMIKEKEEKSVAKESQSSHSFSEIFRTFSAITETSNLIIH